MNLFDSEMAPDEAVRVLQQDAAVMTIEAAKAVHVLIEDRERLKGIASLAEAVKVAQKRYFRDRTDEALQTSKDLERRLDAMLKDVPRAAGGGEGNR